MVTEGGRIMKEWTREERSRIFDEADSSGIEQKSTQLLSSRWRSDFHVQPLYGLMNDPNGFAYYNGRWHLFYQWFPYGPVHGMKHWYHVSSEDLLHWQNEGLAMKPDVLFDNYGCYSGSGFVKDGELYLAYTGNSRDYNYVRRQYQLLAKLGTDGKAKKLAGPLISPAEGYTEHQRDPKLFELDGKYYILIGAQTDAEKGTFLLYASESIEEGWQLQGELKVRSYENFGDMVECPDLEKIGDTWVLLFSIQDHGEGDRNLPNRFNNVYFTGQMDFANLEFIPDGPYRSLDCGFDFYAAQCGFDPAHPDCRVLSAWFGCPDNTWPATDEEGWSGLLTMPRVLTVENGKLMQRPAPSFEQLKGELLFNAENGSIVSDTMHGLMPSTAVIRLDDPENESVELNLFTRPRKKGFEIRYDKNRKNLTVDRTDMINQCNTDFGTVRTVHLENGLQSLEVYIDRSSAEIFVNDGEYVLSARIFPDAQENLIRMGGRNIDLKIWKPKKTADTEFVL